MTPSPLTLLLVTSSKTENKGNSQSTSPIEGVGQTITSQVHTKSTQEIMGTAAVSQPQQRIGVLNPDRTITLVTSLGQPQAPNVHVIGNVTTALKSLSTVATAQKVTNCQVFPQGEQIVAGSPGNTVYNVIPAQQTHNTQMEDKKSICISARLPQTSQLACEHNFIPTGQTFPQFVQLPTSINNGGQALLHGMTHIGGQNVTMKQGNVVQTLKSPIPVQQTFPMKVPISSANGQTVLQTVPVQTIQGVPRANILQSQGQPLTVSVPAHTVPQLSNMGHIAQADSHISKLPIPNRLHKPHKPYMRISPENDVQKKCQDAKMTALERKLVHMEKKLKLVTAELEQVKEQVRDKINLETENCQLKSEIDKYKEQCSELQNENERLQKYLRGIESAKVNVEKKNRINFYSTDLTQQVIKVNESNNDALNINSLPDEIIIEIFRYLNQKKLGQIARVCKKWNDMAKDPVLWKEVYVIFFSSHKYQMTAAKSFINKLPSCVTSITLCFEWNRNWVKPLEFVELCLKLQEKFPRLEKLKVTHAELSESLPTVTDLCAQFLLNVKNLTFHNCNFLGSSPRVEFRGSSKIEVLDVSCCKFTHFNALEFSRMPYLKVLHLYYTSVKDFWFHDQTSFFNQLQVLNLSYTKITARTLTAIQIHGFNLKELYICRVNLQNHDLNFNNFAFPNLRTICLRSDGVTCENVASLIQSCPSLENVYVKRDLAKSFTAHPFVVANRCKSGIVKAIKLIHKHNEDYLHKWILF